MTPEELDELPFGLLRLDADGEIEYVNRPETQRVGREPEDFVGRNFFEDVAPCTNVREFAGTFRAGARAGDLKTVFEFTYPFDGGEQRVIIYIASVHPGYGWVMATLHGT